MSTTHLSHVKHTFKQPSPVDIFCEKCWKVYGGERRWLAGCLLLAGGAEPTFQLRPLNVFFTEKPDEEVDYIDFKDRIHISFPPRCQTYAWRLLGSLRRVPVMTSHLLCVFEAPKQYCNLFRARMGRPVREGSSESCASSEVWQV